MPISVEEELERSAQPAAAKGTRASLVWRFSLVALMFLVFAGDLLRTWFSDDDFMNLYKYMERGPEVLKGLYLFWSSSYYRPMGALAYLGVNHLFDFHPLPFKLLVLCLLLINLAVATFVAKTLLRSTRLAALVALLICYQASENELYYNFGTIYDLLGYLFLYSAFALYIHVRERGLPPGPRLIAAMAVLQICALDCKEMCVSLPVLLLLYELFAQRAMFTRRIPFRSLAVIGLNGLLVLIFILGKGSGADSLTNNSLYKPAFTIPKYLDSMAHYLNFLLYSGTFFDPLKAAALIVLVPVAAYFLKSRLTMFGWLWFLTALLPVNFIASRAGFVLYMPQLGFAIALVALLSNVYQRFATRVAASPIRILDPRGAIVFLAFLAVLSYAHHREKKRFDPPLRGLLTTYHHFGDDFQRLSPDPDPGAQILFLNDPFPERTWDALFVPALLREDWTLKSARARFDMLVTSSSLLPRYTEIYDYKAPHVRAIPKNEVAQYIASRRSEKGFLDVLNGVYLEVGEAFWTQQDFSFHAGCPASVPSCQVFVDLTMWGPGFAPGSIHHLTVSVDGSQVADVPLSVQMEHKGVAIPINNQPEGHRIDYHFDTITNPASHPADNRPLALLLRHGMIEAN